jgi:hypothetical protein
MLQFDILKPSELSKKPEVKVTIEYDGEVISMDVFSVFGGAIVEYIKDSPTTCVIPLVAGDMTPGMVFSYVSSMLTCAMDILNKVGIPKDLLKDIAHIAIDEGLYGKIIKKRD